MSKIVLQNVTHYIILLPFVVLSNLMKYAKESSSITQVTLLTNVMHYQSNEESNIK